MMPINKQHGILFSFEGIDACGKTTQISAIYENLRSLGYETVLYREPGSTKLGEEVRKIVLMSKDIAICARAEVLLYVASRAQLVAENVLPLLESGTIVLLDRYADSSVAYQGFGRHLPVEEVIQLNDFAIMKRYPDKTFYFDISAEEAEKRMSGKDRDRLEAEKQDFFERVRNGYLSLAKRDPQRFVVLDGNEDREKLRKEVLGIILKQIGSV
jgi:dTMP kinase